MARVAGGRTSAHRFREVSGLHRITARVVLRYRGAALQASSSGEASGEDGKMTHLRYDKRDGASNDAHSSLPDMAFARGRGAAQHALARSHAALFSRTRGASAIARAHPSTAA